MKFKSTAASILDVFFWGGGRGEGPLDPLDAHKNCLRLVESRIRVFFRVNETFREFPCDFLCAMGVPRLWAANSTKSQVRSEKV